MFDEGDGNRFRLRPESPDDSTLIGIEPRKEKALIFYFDPEEKGLEDESHETIAQQLWLQISVLIIVPSLTTLTEGLNGFTVSVFQIFLAYSNIHPKIWKKRND